MPWFTLFDAFFESTCFDETLPVDHLSRTFPGRGSFHAKKVSSTIVVDAPAARPIPDTN